MNKALVASMLNTSWKGDVEQWRSDLMEQHMEIGKIKFTYREISLLGVMISAEKISPSLFSQVALISDYYYMYNKDEARGQF